MSANHLSQRMRSSAGEVAYGAAGSGPDLVLIHGTPFSSRIWSSVIDRLSSRFRIHFLDLPGYGRSDKFEGQEVRLRSFVPRAARVRRACRAETASLSALGKSRCRACREWQRYPQAEGEGSLALALYQPTLRQPPPHP